MDILHILRSEPDTMIRMLIKEISRGFKYKEVCLYASEIDYNQLLKDIFQSEKVICWW